MLSRTSVFALATLATFGAAALLPTSASAHVGRVQFGPVSGGVHLGHSNLGGSRVGGLNHGRSFNFFDGPDGGAPPPPPPPPPPDPGDGGLPPGGAPHKLY
jgi:hypothetical protein